MVRVDGRAALTERFEEHRSRLGAVSYRMLGSLSEADDAVQEAWLRLNRADVGEVAGREDTVDPEQEAVMADSVGLALLVVLDTLTPAERLAFVLHDLFAVSFDEIAPLLGRTSAATRQLASRARRRVKGAPLVSEGDLTRRRRVVEAFLAATRGGNFDDLVSLLHPDVVLRADRAVGPTPRPLVVTGAVTVAKGAMAAMQRARSTQPALVDGTVGLAMAPLGRLFLVLEFTIEDDLITGIDITAEPERLAGLELAVLDA
ncbi:sigma factor-like helix-turn-helix DNA-binding protein [Streptomyces erythrochromogenes]|uniref:sigma factor-like helix-turn-helix DNA-binding protein n=1 Tax=Streptomyces erythrochromogenes TaxID=285574 RepID=UPI0036FD8681